MLRQFATTTLVRANSQFVRADPWRMLLIPAHINSKINELQSALYSSLKSKTISVSHNSILSDKQSQKHHSTLLRRSRKEVSRTVLPDNFKMEYPKITLFGDSITRRAFDPDNGCWASMIAHHVGSFCNVDNRGLEGYNTKWSLELMSQLFPKSYLDKVEIFIPFFGHNDAWEEAFPAHVPVDQFENNFRAIIKYLIDNGLERRKIIMITPTWYCDEEFKKYMKEMRLPLIGKEFEVAKKYTDAVLKVARDNEIDVIDFFKVSAKYEPLRELFCDGIHYSKTGAKLLFDHLMPVIKKKLEASFKKPLVDLWHVTPFDKHPEMEPVLRKYQESLEKK